MVKTLFNKESGIQKLKFTMASMTVVISTIHTPLQLLLWNLKINEIINVFNLSSPLNEGLKTIDIQMSHMNDLFCVLGNDGKIRIFDASKGNSTTDMVFEYGAINSESKLIFLNYFRTSSSKG